MHKCVLEITQSSKTTCDFLLDIFDFYCLINTYRAGLHDIRTLIST